MKDVFRHNGQRYVKITPVQQLKSQNEEMSHDVMRQSLENDQLGHECNVLNVENTDLLESNANLAFKVNELESQINILNNTNEDLQAEIDDWRNK